MIELSKVDVECLRIGVWVHDALQIMFTSRKVW